MSASSMIPAETMYPLENPVAKAWLAAAFCSAAAWAADRCTVAVLAAAAAWECRLLATALQATVLATYVMGAVIREAREIRGQRDRELVEADVTADELQAERERFRKRLEASGRYPRIARFMEAGIDPDDPETRDERFEFGLDCMLDGIAARLQSRG